MNRKDSRLAQLQGELDSCLKQIEQQARALNASPTDHKPDVVSECRENLDRASALLSELREIMPEQRELPSAEERFWVGGNPAVRH